MGVAAAAITAAMLCMSQNVYFEARNESVDSQRAVIEVTLNRVDDHRYPDSVCAVVWAGGAFSWTQDGKSDKMYEKEAYAEILALTVEMMTDPDEVLERSISTHYYRAGSKKPHWATVFNFVERRGSHLFYHNQTKYK